MDLTKVVLETFLSLLRPYGVDTFLSLLRPAELTIQFVTVKLLLWSC